MSLENLTSGSLQDRLPLFVVGSNENSSDSLMLPHAALQESLELAQAFNENDRPLKGEFFRRDFKDFSDAVSGVQGYEGTFGTGYPFYAIRPDGGVYPIQEISRYIGTFVEKLDADAARALGAWPCAACQVEFELPDLKQACKPCDIVDFKPRDLFRAMPDADFWVIVDKIDDNTEADIERRIRSAGFYTSDESIKQAFDKTVEVLKDIDEDIMPANRLPIDLHIVEKEQLLGAIRQVPENLRLLSRFVPITPRSLHVKWEDADMPYDFAKDFLFSLTENDWRDEKLLTALAKARQATKAILAGAVVGCVSEMAPKEARQLETPAVYSALEKRVASW